MSIIQSSQKKADQITHNDSAKQCPHCEYTTSRGERLSIHIKVAHKKIDMFHQKNPALPSAKQQNNLPNEIAGSAKRNKCPKCDFVTVGISLLNMHIKLVHKKINCVRPPGHSIGKVTAVVNLSGMVSGMGSTTSQGRISVKEKCVTMTTDSAVRDEKSTDTVKRELGTQSKKVRKNTKDKKCPQCEFVTGRKSTLQQHINSIHIETTGGDVKIKDKKCPQCDFVTCRSDSLHRHVKSKHIGTSEKDKILDKNCTQCEFATCRADNLLRHVRSVHTKAGSDKLRDKKCTQCEFVTCRDDTLQTHVKKVHKQIQIIDLT
jgi:uncharacterized C2H2 Zn-finger protein